MAFCPQCGKQLSGNATFCGFCGAKLNSSSGQSGANTSNSAPKPIPTFTPPSAPTFTPPQAPTFAPPVNRGPVCHYHNWDPAVARCARCGKHICQDCAEAYGVSGGEYAGQYLCYDCCQELVAQNVEELKKNKSKIKVQFVLSIIGMIVGFIFGFAGVGNSADFGTRMVAGLLYACIGGVFLTAMKAYLSATWEAIKLCFSGEGGWIAAIIFLIIRSIVIAVKCIVLTIVNTVRYIVYLKKTSGFIESDTAALQQMRDYMEYTMVCNQNKGVDLESLMSEGSALYNNSYAQAVRNNGEEAADAMLRQATTMIAENGEIIRNFPAAA